MAGQSAGQVAAKIGLPELSAAESQLGYGVFRQGCVLNALSATHIGRVASLAQGGAPEREDSVEKPRLQADSVLRLVRDDGCDSKTELPMGWAWATRSTGHRSWHPSQTIRLPALRRTTQTVPMRREP